MECDVLVVGAGPAGCSAAVAAAKLGVRTVIIDKRSVLGVPVQCAEHIPMPLAIETQLTPKSIAQEVAGTEVYIESEREAVTKAPGYILNREIFDRNLAAEALWNGARLLLDTTAVRRTERGALVRKGTYESEIGCRIIIGADGPASTVGNWADQNNTRFVRAMQCRVRLCRPVQNCHICFEPEFDGGYAWLFPKGRAANVGIGVSSTERNLHQLLHGFLERLRAKGMILPGEDRYTAGLIPVGGPVSTVIDNIMLVGDAAGQTHPISGAGIPQAVICGRLAGRGAARWVLENDAEQGRVYEREWTRIYGSALDEARKKREKMEAEWGRGDFRELVRRSWIGFKEYYTTS